MAKIDSDTLYGTLNLLILKTLGDGPLHGLAVMRRIHQVSDEGLRIEEGALYPALHRLERDGLVQGTWGLSENRRRAKFYELTREGHQRLEGEVQRWVRHATAVAQVLNVAWAETV